MIAIYLRTSTKKQELDSQLAEVKKYIIQNEVSFESCKLYIDKKSGKSMNREKLIELQEAMISGKVKIIYFYALDRLSRQGTEAVMGFLSLANSKSIKVEFVVDQFLNYEDPMIRNILITVMSELARKEREKIVERVNAGLAAAKKRGVKLGRPQLIDPIKIIHLHKKGMTMGQIAKEVGCSKSAVHKTITEYRS